MLQTFLSLFLIISLFTPNTVMGDIVENRQGELVSSDFKTLVNSNLPWCKKKTWGEGYKKDNCWTELAWFENITDNRNLSYYWEENKPNFDNGYAGEWKNNEFHGKGIRIFSDRIIVGNWQANDISLGTIHYFDQKTILDFYEGVKIESHSGRHYVFAYNNNKFIKDRYNSFSLLGTYHALIKNRNEHTFQYYGEIKDLQPHGKGEIRIHPVSKWNLTYPYKIIGNFKDGKLINKARLFFKNNNKGFPDVELDISFINDKFSTISVNEIKAYCGESEILFSGNIMLPVSDKHSHFSVIPFLPNQINSSKSKEIWQMIVLDDEYTIKYDYGDFFISVISKKNLKKIDKEAIQNLFIHEKNQIFSADIKGIGAACYPNNAINFDEKNSVTLISSKGTYTGNVTKKYISKIGFNRYNIGYLKSGKGTIEYPDGSFFKGEWLNDMKEGYGEFINNNGIVVKQHWVLGENSNQIITQEQAKQKRLAQIEKEILLQKGVNSELNPENLKKCERFFNEYMKTFLFLKKLDKYQYNLNESIGKEYLLDCLKDPNKYLYSF